MASEAGPDAPSSFVENLMSSRNRNISRLLPFILGSDSTSPLQGTEHRGIPRESPDRIILINPITQGMAVIERNGTHSSNGSSLGFDAFFNDLFSGISGQPPASKASIDAMTTVDIAGSEAVGEQCVFCLEGWEAGERAKEMPCKHRFHGDCIEKWLKIHGSCPVCRYEMPVDEADDEKKRSGEGEGERRREIWVSFTFSRDRRSGDGSHTNSSESGGTGDS